MDGAPLLVAVNKQDKLDEELRAAEAEDAAGASGGELRYRSVDASANDGGTVTSSSPKGQNAGTKRVESDVDGNGNGSPRRFRTYSTADVLIEFGLDEMAAEKGGPVRVQPTSAITGYAFTFIFLSFIAIDWGCTAMYVDLVELVPADLLLARLAMASPTNREGLYEGVRWLINAVRESPRTEYLYQKQLQKQKSKR